MINVHPLKPLIYEVYCKDEIAFSKKWREDLMVGTFKLKLIEPEPVKMVLKHIYTEQNQYHTCSIKIKTEKLVNIYWGDGAVDYDISGDHFTQDFIEHKYNETGNYFPVITGNINEIIAFETDAIVVWREL
jgi:hypothetical protein